MKQIVIAILGLCIGACHTNAEVIKSYHPEKEPEGLYIATLHMGDSYYVEKTYRIYCPTSMVRDITDNKWGKARSVYDEDQLIFNGAGYLINDVEEICNKKQKLNEPVFKSCENMLNTIEMRECNAEMLTYYDKRLNMTYKEVMQTLDVDARDKLRKAQRAWITFRDLNCDAEASLMSGGTGEMILYGGCLVDMTKVRADELKKMLEEG